jgi:YfiH family protein
MSGASHTQVLIPEWPVPPQVRACVTLRGGGVSSGAYASLNLAAHVGDDPVRVAQNRRLFVSRLASRLGLPGEPPWLEQVHGAAIADLDRGPPSAPADGAVTSRAGTVCAVLTADCLPVLLAHADGRRVGVAHAGWRGLAGGVLPAAVAALGTPPGELVAWLGPAIGPPAFEVGEEVRQAFAAAGFDTDAAFEANERGRWQADLYTLARESLRAAGVPRVFGGGFCTYTDADRFFSHRREAPCGRFATLIWIT